MKISSILATAAFIITTAAKQRITFESSGTQIVGYHWKPSHKVSRGRAKKHPKLAPAVVMGHGLAAVQTAKLQPYAERFAKEGYHAITFDYRHFGQSAGSPRNIVSIPLQQADYHAAVNHTRTLPGVDPDRIIIWGTSLSGGTVLSLGPDFSNNSNKSSCSSSSSSGVVAVIAQVPHTNGPATASLTPQNTIPNLVTLSLDDTKRENTTQKPLYIPVANSTNHLGLLTQPGALAGYEFLEPHANRNIAARFVIQLPLFSPDATAASSRLPTFMGIGSRDNVVSPAAAVALGKRMSRATVVVWEGAGHFDVYPGKQFYKRNLEAQVRFLRSEVPV